MGLPKRRHSKSRTKKRRANWRLTAPNYSVCPGCHEARKLPHRACPACGYYSKSVSVEIKKKEGKAKT